MTVSWATSDPAILRAHHLEDALAREGPCPDTVADAELAPDGHFRGGLLHTPRDPPGDAIILYFHGGGFVAGSPRTHRCVTSRLAGLSGMRVLSGRYRLAPEHPFPAQREDAVAAVGAALHIASGGGVNSARRIVLAGDSAGACVALWGLGGLDPALRRSVKGLALLYGAYGVIESPSIARFGTAANGMDSPTLRAMYRRLLGPGGEDSPGFRALGGAGGITEPAYVLAAERDAVFDESAILHARLANREHSPFVVVPDADHGFLKETGTSETAGRELAKLANWVRSRLTETASAEA